MPQRMIARTSRAARLAAALLLFAAAILHAQTTPRRIVSTSPSVTETLFALGLGDRVVGVSQYCRYPAAVAELPRVGSYLKPNVEAIARLAPDLVFVNSGP
ncbi:MAG TPA: helical backbone metal receptor, partial [Gemmatimonadaceae bacterium]